MAAAANLFQAGQQSWVNLSPLATAGTLRTKLLTFVSTIAPSFTQGAPGDHPVANWIAILWAFAQTMSATAGHWDQLRIATDYLYRLCFMGEQSNSQGLITPTQYNLVLATYNAQF